MRIVCDTNIYSSTYNISGVSRDVLLYILDQGHILCISQSILNEVERISRDKFGWSKQNLADLMQNIKDFSTLVKPKQRLRG